MPILSVFAPQLKSCFFGFYVNGVTLASKKPPLCKGRWRGETATEGLLQSIANRAIIPTIDCHNQSADWFRNDKEKVKRMKKVLFVCHGKI